MVSRGLFFAALLAMCGTAQAANTTTTAAPTTNTTTEAVPTKTWDASAEITGMTIQNFEYMLRTGNPGSFEKAMANVFSKFPNEISEKDITHVKAAEDWSYGTPTPTLLVTFKVAVPDEKNATETLEKFRDTCCVLKTMLGEQGWRSDGYDGPDRWTIYETRITVKDVATTTKAPTTTTTAAPTTNTTTEAVPTKTWDASAEITGMTIQNFEYMLLQKKGSPGSFEKAMANVFSKFPNEISEKDVTHVKAEVTNYESYGGPTLLVTFKVTVPEEKNATETLEKFRDTCCVLKTMLGEQGWRSDGYDGPDSWTIYETLITVKDVATTTKAPTTTTTAAPSGDMFCTTYPATCEVKDSAGTPCVTKFAEYATKEGSQPTCENIEAAGVTKECLPLLVDSKLDFKDTEGKPMLPESDQGIMVAVLSACATGAPIPDIPDDGPDDGPDDKLTPIDASVVLTGMTKDQFDAGKFAIATARTMDISTEDITDVKVEEVAASSKRRSLTATNLKVTFKVAVKDTMEATEVSERLAKAVTDGSFAEKLKNEGITGFTGIKAPTIAIQDAPKEGGDGCDDLMNWAPDFDTTKCDAECATTPCTGLDRVAQCGGCKSGMCFPCSKEPGVTATTTTTTMAATTTTTTTATTTKAPATAPAPTTKSGAFTPSSLVGVAALAVAALAA